jgi:dipeptidase E
MAGRARQIIALGGGGFLMEPDNPALDLYVLRQARAARPAVSFLATARGDSDSCVARFYAAFSRYECRPSHLPFFERTPELRDYLLRQDVIYVGGGNTRSMLAVWREWGLPGLLKEAWEAGAVLAGVSAGAICWYQHGVTDSHAGRLTVLECLGFLSGSCCPHYDGERERRPAYHRFLLDGAVPPGIALDDGAAVHVVDGAVHRVVASRPQARAYRVCLREGVIQEEPLETEYLASAGAGAPATTADRPRD